MATVNGLRSTPRPGGAVTLELTDQDAFIVVPFKGRLHWQKLRVTAAGLEHVRAAQVYYGQPFAEERVVAGWFDRARGDIDFLLPSGEHGPLRIDFDLDQARAEIVVQRVELLPFGLFDQRAMQQLFAYLLALLMMAACIVPGLLVFGVLHRGAPSEVGLQLAFGYSMLFYTALYLSLGIASAPPWVFLLGCGALLALLAWRADHSAVAAVVREHRGVLLWWLALVVGATWLLIFDADRPFATLGFHHIAGWKTFGAIQAHDNYFQYVNGKAIADGEPFSKYYGGGRLTYDVTAREMLPGAVYAVFRKLLAVFSWRLSDSYLVYTAFGTVANAAVVAPVSALANRLFPKVSLWKISLALLATSSFFANVYYTWFKYCGAALFLSGVVVLLIDRARRGSWLVAGVLIGLSVNMHTGNLLGLPAFLAYFAWRHWKEERRAAGPLLLSVVVIASMLPWNFVKARWLHTDNTLFVQHYLDGHQRPEGVGASLRDFLEQTPLERQLGFRAERLAAAARLRELADWVAAFGTESLKQQWVRLGWLEVRYLAPLFYPLVFFAVLSLRRPRPPAPRERWPFALLAAATALVLVLASFGVFPADINFSQPMAVVLVVCVCLSGYVLEGGGAPAAVFLAFAALQALRSLAVLLGHYVTHFD